MVRSRFRGKSLQWVREMKGLPPVYGSARAAAAATLLTKTIDPPIGAICWYHAPPNGNCGIVIDRGYVLGIGRNGEYATHAVQDREWGAFMGWSWSIGPEPEVRTHRFVLPLTS